MYSSTSNITKNIYELQSDVLSEKLSNNPYMPYHVLIEKNKQLATAAQSIVGAVNETLRKINSVSNTNRAALAELYNVLGHIGAHPELTHAVLQEAPSLIELVLSLLNRVDALDDSRNVTFKDQYRTSETPQYVFSLSHVPKQDTLKVFVNGVQYYNTNTNAFIYDSANNEVSWIFTSINGGFDLVDCEIVWEYDYDLRKELENMKGE